MKDKVGGGRMGRDTCQTTVQITPYLTQGGGGKKEGGSGQGAA